MEVQHGEAGPRSQLLEEAAEIGQLEAPEGGLADRVAAGVLGGEEEPVGARVQGGRRVARHRGGDHRERRLHHGGLSGEVRVEAVAGELPRDGEWREEGVKRGRVVAAAPHDEPQGFQLAAQRARPGSSARMRSQSAVAFTAWSVQVLAPFGEP